MCKYNFLCWPLARKGHLVVYLLLDWTNQKRFRSKVTITTPFNISFSSRIRPPIDLNPRSEARSVINSSVGALYYYRTVGAPSSPPRSAALEVSAVQSIWSSVITYCNNFFPIRIWQEKLWAPRIEPTSYRWGFPRRSNSPIRRNVKWTMVHISALLGHPAPRKLSSVLMGPTIYVESRNEVNCLSYAVV